MSATPEATAGIDHSLAPYRNDRDTPPPNPQESVFHTEAEFERYLEVVDRPLGGEVAA